MVRISSALERQIATPVAPSSYSESRFLLQLALGDLICREKPAG
jgi:hypothetical protein